MVKKTKKLNGVAAIESNYCPNCDDMMEDYYNEKFILEIEKETTVGSIEYRNEKQLDLL